MPMFADNLRTLHASMTVAALVIAALVLGAELLIPLAIATILSFMLSPIVRRLVRWRLPRSLAVVIVLGGSFIAAVALTAVLSTQILSLTAELQSYRANIVEKVRWVSSMGEGGSTLKRASDAVEALDEAIRQELTDDSTATPSGTAPPSILSPPAPVEGAGATAGLDGKPRADTKGEKGQPEDAPTTLADLMDSISGPTTTFALTLLFTLFLLLQYEDIRDRVIRLAGTDNLSGTTAAMSDAGSRLSRLFLAQAALNTGFGIVTGIVLALIGVPNPVLWGVVGALARFVPYAGSFIAAVPPIILAAGVDPTWTTAITTALFFLVAEPVMGHLVEPALLGRSIGLSPFAMVISASFWVLIWGPIGLLLAAPLTMLLVVLGAYVPRLAFASILLGDQRALDPHLDLYRRILSGDTAAAIAQVEEEIAAEGLVAAVDTSLLPALRHAAADQKLGRIDQIRREEIVETVEDMIEYIRDGVAAEPAVSGAIQRVVVVPARGPFDELAAKVAAAVFSKTARIAADAVSGASGLSALSHRKSEPDGAAIDALVLVTTGSMDGRLLAILAKRAAQSFPGTRIAVVEAVEPGCRPDRQTLPDGIANWRNLSDAVGGLDFEPSRPNASGAAEAFSVRAEPSALLVR
jgi:predicted PurR-regulated permease PerM